MNKKILFLALGLSLIIAAASLRARDNLGDQFSSGTAVKETIGQRWQISRQVSVTNVSTSAQFYTNVVSTTPGVVGKIIWVPGNSGDQFEIHTATTAAGTTAANEIFVANSVTNSTTVGVAGYPQIFDMTSGSTALDATNGITVVIKPANTSVVSRVFIMFDRNQ